MERIGRAEACAWSPNGTNNGTHVSWLIVGDRSQRSSIARAETDRPPMAACAVAEAAATMLALSDYGVSLSEDIASRSEVWCRHAATTK